MALQLVESPAFASLVEVERVLLASKDRAWVLLLTEPPKAVTKAKPGLQALAYRVLDTITDKNGPLDEVLEAFAKQRPRISYRRLAVNRNDKAVMTCLGVTWLPQVRIVKNSRVLFRSSVSIGDNGQFLAQDVGGKSFRRRVQPGPSGFVNLVDALSAEIDRPNI